MYKLSLEKAEEQDIKFPTSVGSQKKQGNSRKTSTSALLTTLKPLTLWITRNYNKFLKRWEYHLTWASQVAQMVKYLPAMQETLVRSLGQETPKEKGTATHSNILAWIIPWTEEPSALQYIGSQRAGHD